MCRCARVCCVPVRVRVLETVCWYMCVRLFYRIAWYPVCMYACCVHVRHRGTYVGVVITNGIPRSHAISSEIIKHCFHIHHYEIQHVYAVGTGPRPSLPTTPKSEKRRRKEGEDPSPRAPESSRPLTVKPGPRTEVPRDPTGEVPRGVHFTINLFPNINVINLTGVH